MIFTISYGVRFSGARSAQLLQHFRHVGERRPVAQGAGLVSTLGDTVKFIQSFLPGGPTLLKSETIELMFRNQLAAGLCVQFPNMPRFESKGFGLGSSVSTGASAWEPAEVVGEVGWAGLAGTIWWINPRIGIAGVLMTQRYLGFGNPYSLVFKAQAYKALGFR
jgi:CubicO group peptidase (beta-lactamase class C family)